MKSGKKTKMMRAAARTNPEEDPEFQIAPMVDILLVLLIFFMSISSSEVLQTNQNIILPIAKDAKPPEKSKSQTIINVMWNTINSVGSLEVDKRQFEQPSELIGMLSKSVEINPATRVLIRADRHVRYEYLRTVMVAAANAGVANVTFSVVDKDMSAGKAP